MNETKKIVDDKLGELVFCRAWLGRCYVEWSGKIIPLKIRLVSDAGESLTRFQKKTAVTFLATSAAVLSTCKMELRTYCQKVYGDRFSNGVMEGILTPVVVLFEKVNTYGILFKCAFEDEVNLAVKFNGESVEVGTDDILL